MKEKFRAIDASHGKRRRISPIWLAAAASVAILVSALLWFFPSRQTNTLLAEYTKFPNVIAPIEKSAEDRTARDKAYQFYEMGNYEQAFVSFKQLDSVTTVDRLYHALSYLEAGRFVEAQPLFQEVQASSNPRWSNVADWYLMWMFLKQEKRKEALTLLDRIADTSGHRYQDEAVRMRSELAPK